MNNSQDLDPRPQCVRCGEPTNRALAFFVKLFTDPTLQIHTKWFPKRLIHICERCHGGTDKIPVVNPTTEKMSGWTSAADAIMPGTRVVYT